jgi:hypothetical protein
MRYTINSSVRAAIFAAATLALRDNALPNAAASRCNQPAGAGLTKYFVFPVNGW